MEIEYILIHGTNGEGYSDTTVKRLNNIHSVLAYIESSFGGGDTPHIDKERAGLSLYHTDEGDTTERVSVFEIPKDKVALVEVNANITEYRLEVCNNLETAKSKLKHRAFIKITEPDENNTEDLAQGDGEDGYFHFQII
jgi:hypothetical protein